MNTTLQKIISHRGNLYGPTTQTTENSYSSICEALELGFDVEVDVQEYLGKDQKFLLAHGPKDIRHSVSFDFFRRYADRLWIHCKNLAVLNRFNRGFYVANDKIKFHYFYHQEDTCALTSRNYIWIHPNALENLNFLDNAVYVLPEYARIKNLGGFSGVCTDYPVKLRASEGEIIWD